MSRDDDTDSNPLCALTDDLIHECQSESRIAMQSHSASRKAARQEAAAAAADSSATATASLIRAPRFDKSSDAYWLDRAQRRAHSQHASVGEAADGSSSAETAAVAAPRRVRKPRPKKGTRASAFMHWLFDTFDLKDRNRQAKQTTAAVGSEATDAAASTDVSASPPFHVVDVAGGRGQLAFFLSAFHSIPVSVIDPATMEGVRRYSDRYHLQRVQHRRERENNDSSRSSSSAGQTIDQQASPAADSLVGASAGPSLAAASAFTLAATAPIVLSNGVVLPVPWLPELSHFRCLFPDSIALSQHKQFGQWVTRAAVDSTCVFASHAHSSVFAIVQHDPFLDRAASPVRTMSLCTMMPLLLPPSSLLCPRSLPCCLLRSRPLSPPLLCCTACTPTAPRKRSSTMRCNIRSTSRWCRAACFRMRRRSAECEPLRKWTPLQQQRRLIRLLPPRLLRPLSGFLCALTLSFSTTCKRSIRRFVEWICRSKGATRVFIAESPSARRRTSCDSAVVPSAVP